MLDTTRSVSHHSDMRQPRITLIATQVDNTLRACVGKAPFTATILMEQRTPSTWAVVSCGATVLISRDKHEAMRRWAEEVEEARGWEDFFAGHDAEPNASASYLRGYELAVARSWSVAESDWAYVEDEHIGAESPIWR